MRLDHLLVTLGVGSRTQVQKLIRSGQVRREGQPLTEPALPVSPESPLTIGGAPLDTRLSRHVMLYKPADLLTAARDSRQPTVMSLLPAAFQALGCMPVGRLDRDTTGLLVLTTDGELNHRLLSPKRHVDKRYLASVTGGTLSEEHVQRFAQGLRLSDFTAAPACLEILAPDQARLTIHEGKFHQVKRMFEAVGLTVTALHRDRFGPLQLDDSLSPGQWRELTQAELDALYLAAGQEHSPAAHMQEEC